MVNDIFDEVWCEDFESWLRKKRKKGSITDGLLGNRTIKKRFACLKHFARKLKRHHIQIDDPSPLFEHHVSVQRTVIDTMKIEEVNELYRFNPKSKKLERVRDLWVFACHTGLRWEDLVRIRKKHCRPHKNGFLLKKIPHKARNEEEPKAFRVPMTDTALEIFKKYNYCLDLITQQKANMYIKELLTSTGIFEEETDKLSKKSGMLLKRREYFSFHDARRTFITNLINNNVSMNNVMSMTGHKLVRTLQTYIDPDVDVDMSHTNILDRIK